MTDIKQNIDQAELAKFDALASSWWDTAGQSKPLHDINPLRLQFIQQHCDLSGRQVLDVGCGGGILSESLAKLGAHVTGIDMGKQPLNIARLHALEAGLKIDYQHSTVETMAERSPQQFDIVTCMEMLEHVPDPISVINACATLVKPEGYVFFSTLNRHPKAYLLAILGAEYILNMLPKGTHDYRRFIRPSELAAWCRQAGLQVQALCGIHYNPLTKKFALGQDIKVNYLLMARSVQD